MIFDLVGNYFFRDFGNKVEVGDRAVVLKLIFGKGGFFKEGCDQCFFETLREYPFRKG